MIRYIEVNDVNDPACRDELAMYSRLNEHQLCHYYEPELGLFIAESPKVIVRALAAGYEAVSFLAEKSYLNGEALALLEAFGETGPAGSARQTDIADPEDSAEQADTADPEGTAGQADTVDSEAAAEQADTADPEDAGTGTKIQSHDRVIPVYVLPHDLYSGITGAAITRGMICLMKRRPLPSVSTLLASLKDTFPEKEGIKKSGTAASRLRLAVMDNVENPTNVGAMFRSAAALGMDAVLLTSSCADPLYRRAARVSMGTVFQIPWTRFSGYTPSKDLYAPGSAGDQKHAPYSYIDELHALGFKVCAMALKEDSVTLEDPGLMAEEKLAIILGNEGVGLPAETIAACDYTVMIPMAHGVDSLNVAAASAVAFYALTRKPL